MALWPHHPKPEEPDVAQKPEETPPPPPPAEPEPAEEPKKEEEEQKSWGELDTPPPFSPP